MKIRSSLLLITICVFCLLNTYAQEISLAGSWRFAIDRNDKGIEQKWFTKKLSDNIQLPGSMAQNGKGDEVTLTTKWTGSIYDSSFFFRPSLAKYRQPGNVKIPFWLTPVKHYVGPAWYQKEVTIPATWKGRRITLFLERVHFQSRVWVDGKEMGSYNSLVSPHQFDLSIALRPGKHIITLRIDNSIKDANVGPDSHSVSDHTQGNWNGVIGKMLLTATPQVFIEDVQVYPDIQNKLARVKLTVVNNRQKALVPLYLSANSFNSSKKHTVTPVSKTIELKGYGTTEVEMSLPMGEQMLTWDEFNPALYRLSARLMLKEGSGNEKVLQFGMRAIKTNGTRIEVNGRPVFLRGTVNNCEFPLTGYPPMDTASWGRIFRIAKAHGLNHMRFHSWCPPEATFIAADQWGFYLQPEGPSWPNHGTSLGDGRFIDQYIFDETTRMAKAYGNYASYCMLAAGNEPAGRNQAKYLAGFINYWKEKDSRRIYTGASVAMSWPLVPENEYMIKSGARGLDWVNKMPESVSDYRTAIEKFNVPYVTHEMGQWCVFPNFKEIKKYTGVFRARNFELFQEDLKDHGMADQAEDFLMASGKLQALCYKYEIEKALRTPGLAGFQLLGLQDFPGQGTALVGTIDAFWDDKGYSTAKDFSRFCNAVVPLARIPKFVYSNKDTFTADLELYNFGANELNNAVFNWQIKDEKGVIIASNQSSPSKVERGTNSQIGKISLPLSRFNKATQLNLEVALKGTNYANDWDFWVYPNKTSLRAGSSPLGAGGEARAIYYCTELDSSAESVLRSGGSVFLNAAGKVVKGKEVSMYFTPVFWNTSWFKMRPPHVTGMLIQEKHPAFNDFPTNYYNTLQWWEIANKAQVMNLEDFPKGFKPIVQPIDTWFMNRRLALLLEAKVGNGKLMVCSADLVTDTTHRIAARQLFYSIEQYMRSPAFNPKDAVELSVVKDIFQTPSKERWDSFTKDSPDELKPKANL
ncbi:beta-glucuronidase [Chitinophagaceae bacterium LB-8]|uniref:beta-galactosidase n=1 Tax=Paraflavisolibacter caeni TaxID=2982496 RepID=A0A9X2XPF3_9BACT|nr:sugar-binding domain-containing protein [Paraflavisolibacter caeni]MCU7551188.1 beta-glucuronidase [Paraflavisolibacter caeni]